jgi:hypothetical protein
VRKSKSRSKDLYTLFLSTDRLINSQSAGLTNETFNQTTSGLNKRSFNQIKPALNKRISNQIINQLISEGNNHTAK